MYKKDVNCSDLKLYWYELKFGAKSRAASNLCHIVTPLEFSESCTVESTSNNATVCDSGLPVCAYGQSQTDPQCAAQILPSTTLSGVTPTPSSDATGCMLGGVSCHIVYPAVGLGALAVIVVLLLVVIIVLGCIVVKKRKKMQGERECTLLSVVVTKVCCICNYYTLLFVFHFPRY